MKEDGGDGRRQTGWSQEKNGCHLAKANLSAAVLPVCLSIAVTITSVACNPGPLNIAQHFNRTTGGQTV
ncbi:hypothetical protein MLD38_001710 [Melastoma candidum]|uniref:Uncharacterized protein n=1 Tax=Melastoma candidum TaxID=119954 RepID=A0ACB9SE44_9MYRT|nr:hypothetical protein MLD38_001710 [Melastoma candidum]